MNKNNLSWVDNKVFNNPGTTQSPQMRPFMDTAPAQAAPAPAPAPAGVSPATYMDTTAKPSSPMGVSPATYQNMLPNDLGQMTMPQAQNMSPATMPGPVGVSPAQYSAPGAGMPTPPPVFPVQTSQPPAAGLDMGAGMQGTLTRNTSFGPSPIPVSVQGPPTVLDPGYIPAYLRTQIGKRVRAEFNIGTNLYLDRTGILREVGISYFVLEDNVTHVRVMCDLYSLKFLTTEA